MRLTLALLALLAAIAAPLAGCNTLAPQKFTGPNGQVAYLMQCSGFGRTVEGCTEKAAKLCPAGYTVVDRPTGVPGLQQMAGGTLIVPERTMAVECKAGDKAGGKAG